jgi:AP2-like factor, euAP2 lineage
VTNFGVRQSVHKVARQKGISSGRTYTSRYRGVHQTFPTRRWEAQFRRNGKPTSLGCFDREEEAARAYDRMMVWCELHVCENRVAPKSGLKPGFASLPLNFDCGEYENDYEGLRKMTQDELVQNLRRQGRLQATTNNFGG